MHTIINIILTLWIQHPNWMYFYSQLKMNGAFMAFFNSNSCRMWEYTALFTHIPSIVRSICSVNCVHYWTFKCSNTLIISYFPPWHVLLLRLSDNLATTFSSEINWMEIDSILEPKLVFQKILTDVIVYFQHEHFPFYSMESVTSFPFSVKAMKIHRDFAISKNFCCL